MSRVNLQRVGDAAFQKMDKASSELLAITYGTLVTQLIKDLEHVDLVNEHLERMGYNIGVRIIDEFLAKSNLPLCDDFRESGDVLCKVAVKMFLGVTAEAQQWNAAGTAFTLVLLENPLTEFVELPASLISLHYSNLLCGLIRGAFEEIKMKVSCSFEKDGLKGDVIGEGLPNSSTSTGVEIRVQLVNIMKDYVDDEE